MEPTGALPLTVRRGAAEVTRLSCPDCSGILTIEAQGGHGHLTLTCRVGHRFAIPDLLVAKEERLEQRLWSALHGLQEMAELLADLHGYAARQRLTQIGEAFHERAKRTREDASVLRRIIEGNRAVELNEDVARICGGAAT